MSEVEVSQTAGRVSLSGQLTFDSVIDLQGREEALLAGSDERLEVDLGQVSRSDSAGLALLVAWLRSARKMGKSITFLNVPKQLRAIAAVSGLEALLEFSD